MIAQACALSHDVIDLAVVTQYINRDLRILEVFRKVRFDGCACLFNRKAHKSHAPVRSEVHFSIRGHEVFTHNLPWEKAQSLQTLLSHMNSPGKDPREFRPELDKAVVSFLVKAVARDPRERFQTAAEFREALTALPKQ